MASHTERKRQALMEIANSYYTLLTKLNEINDNLIMQGLKEGLNKFLSNAFISKMGRNKHFVADYYSKNAHEILSSGLRKDLVFEHMIPKNIFQKECEERAKNNTLNVEFIIEGLNKYWHIAIVTKEENQQLSQTRKMPENWDKEDIHVRYKNVELIENDFLK